MKLNWPIGDCVLPLCVGRRNEFVRAMSIRRKLCDEICTTQLAGFCFVVLWIEGEADAVGQSLCTSLRYLAFLSLNLLFVWSGNNYSHLPVSLLNDWSQRIG